MSAYLFVFGRSHELSFHELHAFVPDPIIRILPDVARVEDPQEVVDPKQFINRLGGTIKIAREKGKIDAITPEAIAGFLEGQDGSETFGVSLYGSTETIDTGLLKGIKEILLAKGIRARYVAAHEDQILTSVVITKQHVHELIIVAVDRGFIVGETVAVQDFETWSERDYGRPFADPKSGMLPPKVARMAVNLATEKGKSSSFVKTSADKQKSKVLLDPFCGMGTILGEALLSGWKVIGSDQSEQVVSKAKKNLEWLAGLTGPRPVMKQSEAPSDVKFFVCDATHVSDAVAHASVDAIVTEPFMGSTEIQLKVHSGKFSMQEIKNTIKGLEKLYIGCLRDWAKVLKPEGKVVIALPQYAISGRTYFVKNVIDRCETFGYTISAGPLTYSRPQAVVRRQFYIFTKLV